MTVIMPDGSASDEPTVIRLDNFYAEMIRFYMTIIGKLGVNTEKAVLDHLEEHYPEVSKSELKAWLDQLKP